MNILQFFNKLNLAAKLAKQDCLFVLEKLKSFSAVNKLARWYIVKNELPPIQRIQELIKQEKSPLLPHLFNELAGARVVLHDEFYYLQTQDERLLEEGRSFKKAVSEKDDSFFSFVWNEITSEYPSLASAKSNFFTVVGLQKDMRFYGAELERLGEYTALCPEACPVAVDWSLTDKPELYLDILSPLTFTQILSQEAEENLAKLYAFLFFEKSVFVANYSGVAVDENNKVNFVDFDYLYSVDSSLRLYLKEYIQNKAVPQNLAEEKLRRSVETLRLYCPHLDIDMFLLDNISKNPLNISASSSSEGLSMELLSKHGMVLQPQTHVPAPDMDSLSKLLQPPKLKNEKMFAKSSIFYWLPLLLIFMILILFF